MIRAAILLAMLSLAGCADRPPPSHASVAREAACRQRADEAYLSQNRGDVYQADEYIGSTRDAPYASSGLVGDTSAGLAGRYTRSNLLQDCLDGTGGITPGSSPDAPPP